MTTRKSESLEQVYHGVDFSGSKQHRSKIWVATWNTRQAAVTRNGFTHGELVQTIRDSPQDGRRHFWLVDAPFGLPTVLLDKHGIEADWIETLEWLASFEDPRQWRRSCRKVSRVEERRDVDRRAHTPFAPTNLRMFKQTWHCMVSVLQPLLAVEHVAILPPRAAGRQNESLRQATVWIAESCPSSILRTRGWPHTGYKGTSERNRAARQDLLQRLERDDGIAVAREARRAAIEDAEGDALDSLLLLASGRRFAATDHATLLRENPQAAVEGWVYV